MPSVCKFFSEMGAPQIRMEPGTPEQEAEDMANPQELVLEEQQLGIQLVAVAVVDADLQYRHPRITMEGPETILSRKPYQGDILAAAVDERYVQMEQAVARFVWKDEDDRKIASAVVESLIDKLSAIDLKTFICVDNVSVRLKRMLNNRREDQKQEEHKKYQAWKEATKFKG